MDAITLLKDDHKKVKELLEKLEKTSDGDVDERKDLFTRIRSEMEIHEAIEEEIFYPALKEHAEAREIVLEGYEEHHVVDTLLGEMTDMDPGDERWMAKAKVMKENVEHHIEEEEDDMFAKARDVLDESTLNELGERMEARKRSLSGR